MIKQIGRVKLKPILYTIFLFAFSFLIGMNFIIPLFLLALYIYLKIRRQNANNYNVPALTLLFLIAFTTSYFLLKEGSLMLYMPFAFVPMLATLLYDDLELSLLLTLAISFSVAAVYHSPFYIGMLSFISGLSSSMLVKNSRRRTTVIRTGLLVGVIQAISLFFIDRFQIFSVSRYLIYFLNGILSSIIVLGVLPIFEYLFGRVTNISLLELADFNHPLLQRMILEAPGTYHHSLVVGNLSESACIAVGANALLARIGAYYHDIGKLQKPEYFSENQSPVSSKHDALSPTMSKLIIMNHVKEGVELAKKFNINPAIIDFIAQHHGNSLVFYFYRRALENLEEDQEVKEEGFRYTGPKPNKKETAIVLLADSVEAATRALKEPDPAKIEEVVHKVVNNKFIDGQLDECTLTLKDLEGISAVFIRILSGIYHNRVSYPEEQKR